VLMAGLIDECVEVDSKLLDGGRDETRWLDGKGFGTTDRDG
jgi:hypothetical protein